MSSTDDTIVTEIVIKGSAERIFTALTDPRQLVNWWGAEGKFQTTHMEADLRPGGAWSMSGTGMGGQPFSVSGEYLVIERPKLLEMTWQPDWPEPQTRVRFELEEHGETTTVRLTHSGLTEAARARYQGWPWILVLLQTYVQNDLSRNAI